MIEALLSRLETSDFGTFGEIVLETGFKCLTGELPWRNNRQGKSCIPAGIYPCSWRFSIKHGYCYHVDNVPNRTDIEIHSANLMGDLDKGLHCELLGCIALGQSMGIINGQKALLSSRQAIDAFVAATGEADLELTIQWGDVDSDCGEDNGTSLEA